MNGFDHKTFLAVMQHELSEECDYIDSKTINLAEYLPELTLSSIAKRMTQLGYIADTFSVAEPDTDTDSERWRHSVAMLNELLSELCDSSNESLITAVIECPLFRSIVLETILIEVAELPVDLIRKINGAAEALQQQFGHLPVPPARGKSYDATEYVSADLVPDLRRLVDRVKDSLQVHDDACVEELMDAAESLLSRSERVTLLEFCRARDRLGVLLNYLYRGWPVPTSELCVLCRTLKEIVSPKLDRLLSFSKMAIELEEICRRFSGPAPTDSIVHLPVPLALQRHTPIQLEVAVHLKNAAISDGTGSPVRRFLQTSGADPSLSVTLDLCLFLDKEIARGFPGGKALRQLRGVLWDFAKARYSLVVVDADVVGRSFPELASAVQIDQVIQSDDTPRNKILDVITPGYMLRFDDGTQTVLKRASITVSS